ncbi:MAG: glycosyltransferase [bacterium]
MKVLALTNMYPTAAVPHYGIFVRGTLDAIRHADPEIAIDLLFVNGRASKLAYAAAPLRVLRASDAGYDLIHTHYGLLAGAGALFRGPRLITFYGSDVEMPAQFRWAKPFVPRYEGVVVMNERMRERVARPDALILPPGIDLERFAPLDRAEARRRLGLDAGARYVLFPSSPDRRVKRYDLFCAVVEHAARARAGVAPLILGTPGRDDADLPWVYAAADVLLLTSDSEGSPTVVKEALATNLPVVSVDVGDVRTLLGDSRPAHVVASREPAALAAAVVEVLDAGVRSDGRAHAAHLSIDATARAYAALYRRLAGARAAAS